MQAYSWENKSNHQQLCLNHLLSLSQKVLFHTVANMLVYLYSRYQSYYHIAAFALSKEVNIVASRILYREVMGS